MSLKRFALTDKGRQIGVSCGRVNSRWCKKQLSKFIRRIKTEEIPPRKNTKFWMH